MLVWIGVNCVLYVLHDEVRRLIKIGTSANVERRQAEHEAAVGRALVLVRALPGGRREEKALHRRFAGRRLPGTEWFRISREIESWLGVPLPH